MPYFPKYEILVPFMNSKRIAEVLSGTHLGEQITRARHLLLALLESEDPAVTGTWPKGKSEEFDAWEIAHRWAGYEGALGVHLMNLMVERDERAAGTSGRRLRSPSNIKRGTNARTIMVLDWSQKCSNGTMLPLWWGERIHWFHQVMLCRADWGHYGDMFPSVDPTDAAGLTGGVDDWCYPNGDPGARGTFDWAKLSLDKHKVMQGMDRITGGPPEAILSGSTLAGSTGLSSEGGPIKAPEKVKFGSMIRKSDLAEYIESMMEDTVIKRGKK